MGALVGETQLWEQLMSTNSEFRRLAAEHHAYSEQLDKLSSRPYLTDEERLQETTLKKKKLLLKDQMHSIVQKYRKEMDAQSR